MLETTAMRVPKLQSKQSSFSSAVSFKNAINKVIFTLDTAALNSSNDLQSYHYLKLLNQDTGRLPMLLLTILCMMFCSNAYLSPFMIWHRYCSSSFSRFILFKISLFVTLSSQLIFKKSTTRTLLSVANVVLKHLPFHPI